MGDKLNIGAENSTTILRKSRSDSKFAVSSIQTFQMAVHDQLITSNRENDAKPKKTTTSDLTRSSTAKKTKSTRDTTRQTRFEASSKSRKLSKSGANDTLQTAQNSHTLKSTETSSGIRKWSACSPKIWPSKDKRSCQYCNYRITLGVTSTKK